MKPFQIIKKNRKYFSALLEEKYKCRLLIDENSSSLETGIHQLDDISVHSKYGTDLIFKLSASSDEIKQAGICTLKTPCLTETW